MIKKYNDKNAEKLGKPEAERAKKYQLEKNR